MRHQPVLYSERAGLMGVHWGLGAARRHPRWSVLRSELKDVWPFSPLVEPAERTTMVHKHRDPIVRPCAAIADTILMTAAKAPLYRTPTWVPSHFLMHPAGIWDNRLGEQGGLGILQQQGVRTPPPHFVPKTHAKCTKKTKQCTKKPPKYNKKPPYNPPNCANPPPSQGVFGTIGGFSGTF